MPSTHLMAANNNNRALLQCRQPSLLQSIGSSQRAALQLDFCQPLLASHLKKTTTTATTNGEYLDFATLLPISSLLEGARNSQLHLQVGTQGLTIPLPASSKPPKVTSIEKWLDVFDIFSSVLVFMYPSRATALIAYQQLIRDAMRKFPGMAWYVYNVEFRCRASHDLSLNRGNGTSNYT